MTGLPEAACLPVVMYHSVGVPDPGWVWRGLTCPFEQFAAQLRCLLAHGYRTIPLSELIARQRRRQPPSERLVVLSFDDGYLDNWVFAFPLLKRHGCHGIVYVNPEFIDPGEQPRPNLEDVWQGRLNQAELPAWGFLNWGELRAMVASGLVEIGSHSMTHTWYPVGPEIVDFHRPGGPYPWLAWNARPDRKHAYLVEDQSGFVPYGTPVHANGRSLGVRRFFPDPILAQATSAHVLSHGGVEFFGRPDWRIQLQEVAASVRPSAGGRFETDAEMLERYAWEISESRRILARGLGQPIQHFCWPGGAYNDASWRLAEQAGYDSIVVKTTDHARGLSEDPRVVRRLANHTVLTIGGRDYPGADAEALLHACEICRGRCWHRWALRLIKLRTAIRAHVPWRGRAGPA